MPNFPTKQADIETLAIDMARGYIVHPADFPSVDFFELAGVYNEYASARKAATETRVAEKIATNAKDSALKVLEQMMKHLLKISEVDTADDPARLEFIGWGPRQNPQPAEPPAPPENLHIIAEEQGTIQLGWSSPAEASHLKNYIIEGRRQASEGGQFGPWALVATALNNEITLIDQHRYCQLEYRVKAVNTGGESTPSNTAAVVL